MTKTRPALPQTRRAVSLAVSKTSRPEELLLVERSKKLRYFAGYHAFPGGTLDDDDARVPVQGVDDEASSRVVVDDEASSRFVAAGARELFEETGIWLGRGGQAPPADTLRSDRRRLLGEEVSFAALLARYRQHLDAAVLAPLCRITTPPFSPVRYDTIFLRVLVHDDTEIEIWDGELVSGSFVDPAATLTSWRAGEIQVAPPMVFLLDEWRRGQDGLSERIRTVTESYENGKLHRVYFSPGILLAPLETPTQPPATHTNTCLIGEERVYVVDPSPVDPGEQRRLWTLLDDVIAEGRAIAGALLTHYHRDHVGALREMIRRYDVPAYAHPDCADELPDVVFDPLEHGDTLDLGTAPDGSPGWTLTAYHVPGHARGHLAFQESRYGAIVVGDLVSTLSSILIDPRDGHLQTYLSSLAFLLTAASGTLYPGHGPPVPDGARVIRKTIDHRAEREAQLVAALGPEPRSAKALVERIYTDVPEAMLGLAERSLLSGLIKLEEEGVVTRTDAGYSLV